LAYGLNDSPVAQLAWIVEKFAEWTDPARPLPHEAVDRDQLLALVSLCWFTESGGSSAHFTYEGMKAFAARMKQVQGGTSGIIDPKAPPVGVSVFAGDFSIRSLLDPQHAAATWTEYDRGGHFPAMEVPALFVSELQAWRRAVAS
jgi:epoxide hydrolase